VLSTLTFFSLYVFRAELYQWTEVEPATRGDLYPVARSATVITGFERLDDKTLLIDLSNADDCGPWSLALDGIPADTVSDSFPVLPLREGIRNYRLEPANCELSHPGIDALELDVHFAPLSTPSAAIQGLNQSQIQINQANLPIRLGSSESLSRWVPDIEASHPADQIHAARSYLEASGINMNASERELIAALARHVRRVMPDGTPPAYLNTLHPFDLLYEAETNGVGCFCRQWALVYTYLANVAGMPTRLVFTGGADPNVDMGSHAFAETYVASEASWAYVDPTNDISFITNRDNRLLSGADVYNASISRSGQTWLARSIAGAADMTVPYPSISEPVTYFMHRMNFLIFFGSKDGRYQMDPHGFARYPVKIERFISQPQQYYGALGFKSYHWLRPLSFYAALLFGMLGLALIAMRWCMSFVTPKDAD